MNKKPVYENIPKELFSFVSARIVSGIISALMLVFLVEVCALSEMIAKLITEILFFVISWTVQKYVIFFSAGDAADTAAAGEEETA